LCFLFIPFLVEHVFLAMVTKTMELYVLPHLEFITITFNSFDLWMSKGDINTFVFVINYFNEACIPRHTTKGLFEMHETNGNAMALQFQFQLESSRLILCDCIFQRWRKQLGNHGYNITINNWLWTIQVFASLWEYLLWACGVLNMSICDEWYKVLWV